MQACESVLHSQTHHKYGITNSLRSFEKDPSLSIHDEALFTSEKSLEIFVWF